MNLEEVALARPSLKLTHGVNEGSTLDISHGATFSRVSHIPQVMMGSAGIT